MKRYSIIQDKQECWVCHQTYGLHKHEAWFGKNRKNSIEDGLMVYLCSKHHNGSDQGVHFNHKLDVEIKKVAEQRWLEHYKKTKEDFIKKYGKNILN